MSKGARRADKAASEDAALWQDAMREVTPLRRGAAAPLVVSSSSGPTIAPEPPPQDAAAPGPAGRVELPRMPKTPPRPAAALDRFADLDRANAERLKRGRHPIEARLDLHGLTQAEAHVELASFVAGARAAGRRCVLVITGRGLGSAGGGTLRQSVPRWLEEAGLRWHVLAIASAQPHHGGAGALYVLLRRGSRS